MSIYLKYAPGKDWLLGAWCAQVAETATQTPWLVQDLIRRKSELLPKFAAYYHQLRVLPRRTWRLSQWRLAPSLAGTALLLAWGQEHAVAATTNVPTSVPDITNAEGQYSLIEAITPMPPLMLAAPRAAAPPLSLSAATSTR